MEKLSSKEMLFLQKRVQNSAYAIRSREAPSWLNALVRCPRWKWKILLFALWAQVDGYDANDNNNKYKRVDKRVKG